MDPNQHGSLEITCEINPPTEGIDRHCGGVFLKDIRSGFYLAHSGRVGGGRKGIGKTAFLETYSGKPEEIEWPDGVTSDLVVLGKIGGRAFLNNLSGYIHAVEAFKAEATGQTLGGSHDNRNGIAEAPQGNLPTFQRCATQKHHGQNG